MSSIQWNPKLWVPLRIDKAKAGERGKDGSHSVKSFFDYQDPQKTYEVRGILPRAEISCTY